MFVNDEVKAKVRAAAMLLDRVPEGEYVSISDQGLGFSTTTQEELRRIREWFPGAIWSKEWVKWCSSWVYRTAFAGAEISIFCTQAPPTCTRVETKRLVKKQVPTAFEEKEVEEIEVSWDCGGGA